MKALVAALGAALMTLTLFVGSASATAPTPASGQLWAANQRVTFRWKDGLEPPAWMRTAVNAAAADNNQSRDSKAAVLSQSDSGASSIAYTPDIPTTYAIGYTIGYQPTSFAMRLRPQGYVLDWGTLRWCQFYDVGPTGCYDAEMITLHEMGHVQTLDHPDDADVTEWTDTIMHWAPKTKAKAGWNQHEFGRCDVARLQIRYEPLTAYTPYSTCLDLDTDLQASASASTAAAGAVVTVSARLKVADSVIWPLLAGEPVAGRPIVLQRRAPGGSTWSLVANLAPTDDTGHYARSITVNDTYDYRVVFNAGQEGLEDATSLVLRITVTSSGGGCGYGLTQIYTC